MKRETGGDEDNIKGTIIPMHLEAHLWIFISLYNTTATSLNPAPLPMAFG